MNGFEYIWFAVIFSGLVYCTSIMNPAWFKPKKHQELAVFVCALAFAVSFGLLCFHNIKRVFVVYQLTTEWQRDYKINSKPMTVHLDVGDRFDCHDLLLEMRKAGFFLKVGEKPLDYPVEIVLACNLDKNLTVTFSKRIAAVALDEY